MLQSHDGDSVASAPLKRSVHCIMRSRFLSPLCEEPSRTEWWGVRPWNKHHHEVYNSQRNDLKMSYQKGILMNILWINAYFELSSEAKMTKFCLNNRIFLSYCKRDVLTCNHIGDLCFRDIRSISTNNNSCGKICAHWIWDTNDTSRFDVWWFD